MTNQLVELFNDVARQFEKYSKKRAASVWEIWSFVQEQLEVEYMAENPNGMDGMEVVYDDYGNPVPMPIMCPSYVLDVYLNAQGMFALVTKSDGKLYKIPVTVLKDNTIVLGDMVEVFMEALPVVGRQVSVKRGADGVMRWFAMPACTAVVNRSGEIDSKALFDSFAEHIMRTEDYPELDFYHMGESIPLGKADWVGRDGVAYCASGTFYNTPIARAAQMALENDPNYWGLSIAYIPTSEPTIIRAQDDVQIKVYNSGVNRFISLLPEKDAASILTSISTKEEVTRMNEKVLAALEKLTGGDKALIDQYKMKLDAINRSAQTMISRDTAQFGQVLPAANAPVVPLAAPAAAEVRALAAEDITALLADPAFEAKVTEIYNKLELAEAQDELDAATAAAGMQQNQRSAGTLDTLTKTVQALSAQVTALTKTREAADQQLLDDMPAKGRAQQPIYRPRATLTPGSLNGVNRKQMNMAEIAERTMANIEQS